MTETFYVDASGVVTRARLTDPTTEYPTPDAVIAIGPTVPDLWCVVYRTGGTLTFKWRRSLAMHRDHAWAVSEGMRRAGSTCHVENYFASLAVGLPETFSPDFPLVMEWH